VLYLMTSSNNIDILAWRSVDVLLFYFVLCLIGTIAGKITKLLLF